MKTMYKNNDSCPRGRLRLILLCLGLGKGIKSVKEEERATRTWLIFLCIRRSLLIWNLKLRIKAVDPELVVDDCRNRK